MKTRTLVQGAILGGTVMCFGCGDDPSQPNAVADPSVQIGALTSETVCGGSEAASTRFYVPPPNPGAVSQIAGLVKAREFRAAARLSALAATPQAAWFTSGSPEEVRTAVHGTMVRAEREHSVPILVAYNIPFRDCAQYSAGGATDTAAYDAWIDGFAQGIGHGKAIVILEPDGLGIIPYNTTIDGAAEWCRPTVTDAAGNTAPAPGASPAERYAQLNHAVDSIKANAPSAALYLDGTHSSWLSAGEIASRLARAGVQKAKGLFLDVSNFQPTRELVKYGTWISKCIYYANNPAEGGWRIGHYSYCASQYTPANPSDFSTWALTDQWYADNVDAAANPPTGSDALAHFVIDTSRDGQGPLDATRFASPPTNQPAGVISVLNAASWCNPPGAGAGLRPTARTGVPLVDAYLWIKIPGESDGSCDIAGGARAWDYSAYNPWGITGDAQNHFDPLWGMVDPGAGAWFPEQALQLARNANPPFLH